MNKYQGDVIRIEKLDPARVYTALYWDNAAKAYYIKRFSFTESNNTPLLFISDARGSKLVDISADARPQVVLTFGKKFEHKEPEVIDAEQFIAKKGITAKGKKCSPMDLKSVEFTDPLPVEETEAPVNEEPMDVVIDEDFTDLPSVDEYPEMPAPDENEGPVDLTDWEPTLF